ncbi:FAD-dependent oxidoreductase [Mesorhizobium sp. SP-1A]|uniref:NAD(P)/FAD-dependent oxidoreductase n=1 Tax=Mesorhizobium sp. SP-1A TaxID=3077840 RepID=UPI0028F6F934|nr:FAD-dependent oxidoreductase [Mesorhizobium sp. SP-1A]
MPEDGGSVHGSYDVAVIGSGYTGLSAAHRLTSSGMSVLVIDAQDLGFGASTRNGGMVSGTLKLSHKELCDAYDRDTANALFQEAQDSVLFLEQSISEKRIECDYQRMGMYFAAYAPKHYEALAREAEELADLGVETRMVPRAEQHGELASDIYYGGRTAVMAGGLHPAKYHAGLVAACRAAGVEFRSRCRVRRTERQGAAYVLSTDRGSVRAGQVIIATNAYTDPAMPWFRRRVIPIGSYIIATEQMDPARLRALIPAVRMIQDTKRNLFYYRLSPDGTRMIFGGRTSFRPISTDESAARLHAAMSTVFPSLVEARVEYSWTGNVAFTFQKLPHVGQYEGIHFALGCCGQGVALMSYFGDQIGRRILGQGGDTAFARTRFTTMPGYSGHPWFLPAVGEFYRLLDWLERPKT